MSSKKKTCTVLGVEVPVSYKRKIHDDDRDGEFDSDTNSISIKSTLKKDRKRAVKIHEKTHALLTISGIAEALSAEVEEQICKLMETGFRIYREELLEEMECEQPLSE